MPQTLRGIDADRLERSCKRRRDPIRFGTSAPGLERAAVSLGTCAFEPHRHDTYAIGITTAGVQTFHYRYPNLIPLPATEIKRMRGAIEALDVDRVYGAWWDWTLTANAKPKVLRSADRYINARESASHRK
jgi:AraC-like ligand binding domain